MMRTVLDGFALFEELLDFGSDDAVKHFMIRTFCQHENSLPKLYFLFCKNVLFVFPTICVFLEKCSERFSKMFREIYWKDLKLFCKEKIRRLLTFATVSICESLGYLCRCRGAVVTCRGVVP